MKKQSNAYWSNRFDRIEESANKKGRSYVLHMRKQYAVAQKELQEKIDYWLARIAKNNNISIDEARRYLDNDELKEFKWTLEEYIRRGKENAVDQRWMKELENASARVHIRRYEAMQLEVHQQVEMLMAGHLKACKDLFSDVYKDTYCRTLFEIENGLGISFKITKLDTSMVKNVLSKPWAVDGSDFSSRIWTHRKKLINTLNQEISKMVLLGGHPKDSVNAIMDRMNASRVNAERLVFTEQAYFTSIAQNDGYKSLGLDEYRILATLDGKTCEHCGGMDDKIFDVKNMEIGVNAPPFHPRCRCTTAPYFEDMKTDRVVKGEAGISYKNFEDWKMKNGID